jgi:hypothetical protein
LSRFLQMISCVCSANFANTVSLSVSIGQYMAPMPTVP